MAQELITMTPKELSRYEVIKRLIAKEINGTEASKQLDLSVRQIKRVKVKVKKYGVKGIIHGLRGQPSNKKLPDKKIEQIKQIVRDKCIMTLVLHLLLRSYQKTTRSRLATRSSDN